MNTPDNLQNTEVTMSLDKIAAAAAAMDATCQVLEPDANRRAALMLTALGAILASRQSPIFDIHVQLAPVVMANFATWEMFNHDPHPAPQLLEQVTTALQAHSPHLGMHVTPATTH